MTPEQKIKKTILLKAIRDKAVTVAPAAITAETVDQLYDESIDGCQLQDYQSEMRSGEVETGLACPYSRHYESKAVAANIGGEWIGWTYWYGGGKHGEPEAVEWMGEAYLLDCSEEQKVVTVRTFTVKERITA